MHEFLNLPCHAHYDHSLLGVGAGENWIFSVCPAEDISSPTPEPETSQPSTRYTECLHEPTDGEPEAAVSREPACTTITEPIIALEPEPEDSSDQVHDPATLCVAMVLVEMEGLEGTPTLLPLRLCCNWPLAL
ncbi:hypothetical protein E1301_Tti013312 [Triplophysa tibetana]|uniref:Uncharacterized protein n=1 Tax=Triplophysa tibetana TaxID=1572043 RepID=A0A5A9N169_9TELE|nr:hypothetical protein E1301_Tti013312 [Triplophysa tibetana]